MFGSTPTIVLILFSVFPVLFLQQIFENHRKCRYFLNDKIRGNENLELQDKLWQITGSGTWLNWTILFSPCGTSMPPATNCNPDAVVCLINSWHSEKSVSNAGKSFNYTFDENSNGVLLQSVNGQLCGGGKYTATIMFDCQPNTMTAPSVLSIAECELHIRMMKPNCIPPCTLRESGDLIDLRPLQKLPTLKIEEPVTGRLFGLSFCKASRECGEGISACELFKNGNTNPISNTESHLMYNHITNNLIIKGHFHYKGKRQSLEIDIKCKWNGNKTSVNYVVPMVQGRKYKFEAESSLACIKLPMNCLFKDTDNDFVYNLSYLNKKTGWEVRNVTDGSIKLNVCGPLESSFQGSICNDQHSQICLTTGTNEHINLGSIPTHFHIAGDRVKGTFKYGSVCASNYTYTTEMEFICAKIDKGPLLEEVNNCTYKIKWETPAICPKFVVTAEDNCVISDLAGVINLNAIHTASDREYTLTETSFLRYNLCGKLNRPCNRNNDTSICYIKDGVEYVVGLSSKILTRDNKTLGLNLIGDACSNTKISKTLINFHCDHSAPEEGRVIASSEDSGCLFKINIDTPLACIEATTTECKFSNNNMVYNLSPLSRPDGDYIIKSNLGTYYIMNICRSVTNEENFLCSTFSGACLHNTTEPHLKYKYLSLGKVSKRIAFEDGILVIRYTHGSRCTGNELFHSTTIKFYCSANEEGPRLSDRKTCSHEFVWHTPHACPEHTLSLGPQFTNSMCEYTDPHTQEQIDFSRINKLLNISTADGSYLVFNLCDKNYTHCTGNGAACKFINSRAELLSDHTGPYLEYRLENECHSQGHANRLHIHLLCDIFQNNEHFNFTTISNCVFQINLITSLACRLKEGKPNLMDKRLSASNEIIKQGNTKPNKINSSTVSYALIPAQSTQQNRIESVTSTTNVEKIKHNTHEIPPSFVRKAIKYNCSVNVNNKKIDLMTIQPTDIISPSGNKYTLNLNGNESVCNGYICKNESVVISEANSCPFVQFDNTQNVIKLLYSGYTVCNTGYSEVWLKCDAISNEQPKIFMESKCNIKALYPVSGACLLLMFPEVTDSTTEIAIGSSIGLVITAAAITGLYVIIKKRSPNMCSRSCYQEIPEDKEHVAVYIKDTKL